jgi:hypothetical protein
MLAKAMRFRAFAAGADGRGAREEEKAGEGSGQLTGPGPRRTPAFSLPPSSLEPGDVSWIGPFLATHKCFVSVESPIRLSVTVVVTFGRRWYRRVGL